jgi:hypothetical protein
MAVSDFSLRLEGLFGDIAIPLEVWCIEFNKFAIIYFQSIKFIFALILLMCGISTLLKLRGFYFKSRLISSENKKGEKSLLTKPRLILGSAYIILACGILFNYFICFLIWAFEPLPDRLIFNFIPLIDLDPYITNRITDIHSAIYPHEKTFYYIVAMLSFSFTLHLILSIWYFIYKSKHPRQTMKHLVISISGVIIFGFTTFMPLML